MISIKTIKVVEFGLENCEVLSIEGRYIGNFQVRNLKNHISKHYQSITHMSVCDDFSIAINRNANKDYLAFDVEEYKHNTFERLSSGDIVSVDLVYSDNTKDSFYVDWVGDSDYINEAQHTYINNLGDLFIVVSKDKNVESEFIHWDINGSSGAMEMMWKFNGS